MRKAVAALGWVLVALAGCGRADGPAGPPERVPMMRPSTWAQAAPSGRLSYYGGHVIPSVNVYAVAWGSSVDGTVQSQIGGFLSAVTDSRYMDWLLEYDTNITAANGNPGTNQLIGRGTFAGNVTISPSVTGASVDNTQIQAELDAQITSGALPAPDANTLYMVFFPPGVTITVGGSGGAQSCTSFCGYHYTFLHGGTSTFYAVVPDQRSGACATSCVYAADTFQENCVVASHEMVEAITDAEVGLASGTNLPPVAWYDNVDNPPTGEEIGDLCAGSLDQIAGYVVQQEWSNSLSGCITYNPAVPTPTPTPGSGGGSPLIPGTGIYAPSCSCEIVPIGPPGLLALVPLLSLVALVVIVRRPRPPRR